MKVTLSHKMTYLSDYYPRLIQLNLLLTAEIWVIHDDGIGLLAADWDRTSFTMGLTVSRTSI